MAWSQDYGIVKDCHVVTRLPNGHKITEWSQVYHDVTRLLYSHKLMVLSKYYGVVTRLWHGHKTTE